MANDTGQEKPTEGIGGAMAALFILVVNGVPAFFLWMEDASFPMIALVMVGVWAHMIAFALMDVAQAINRARRK